jgi:hypothetical protein
VRLLSAIGVLAVVVAELIGCGGGSSGEGGGTTPAMITVEPINQTVTVPEAATFSATAVGVPAPSYQWQMEPAGGNAFADIAGATSNSYTTPATSLADNGELFRLNVVNSTGAQTSPAVTLTVSSGQQPPPSNVTVLTYHNDNGRTGQNLNESILSTANVNSTQFGMVGTIAADGLVDAEPLYVGGMTINGGTHNVLFVATENDSVYAFDADTLGAPLWQKSMLIGNETASNAVNNCDQVTPTIGITSTPVIDLSAGAHGTIFVVAMSKDSSGNYHQRLHALDLTTGNEQASSPATIQATFMTQTFNPEQYEERSGLLLLNGVIYTGWTSHCDDQPYTGWIMGYGESSLQQTSVLNVTPNGSQGGIWMAGAGLAADSSGNIYFLDGNGTFDSTSGALQANGDYGNAFIKLSTSGNTLAVADFFATQDTVLNSNHDQDLGSGGLIVLPDLQDNAATTWHLAVGAGKKDFTTGKTVIFVVNRDSMGKFNASNDNAVYQEITTNFSNGSQIGLDTDTGVFSMPAYFNNTVYYGAVDDNVRSFSITNAMLGTTASSASAAAFAYPGTTPSVSANGSTNPPTNGIVWAVENGNTGVLHAYDATNLATELYNSSQAANGRDQFADNKFITPMIANGKVYVGTPTGVAVFGLFNQGAGIIRKPNIPRDRRRSLRTPKSPHPGSSTPGE